MITDEKHTIDINYVYEIHNIKRQLHDILRQLRSFTNTYGDYATIVEKYAAPERNHPISNHSRTSKAAITCVR